MNFEESKKRTIQNGKLKKNMSCPTHSVVNKFFVTVILDFRTEPKKKEEEREKKFPK